MTDREQGNDRQTLKCVKKLKACEWQINNNMAISISFSFYFSKLGTWCNCNVRDYFDLYRVFSLVFIYIKSTK